MKTNNFQPHQKFDIVIRADGSSKIGIGHLIRARVLKEKLREAGLKVILVTILNDTSRNIFFNDEDIFYLSPEERMVVTKWPRANLYIVDLYYYGNDLYRQLKTTTCELIFVFDDEISDIPVSVDGVINHNIYAKDEVYPQRLIKFCGSKFFLIRKEIIDLHKVAEKSQDIFISMGGSDPEKQTLRMTRIARQSTNRFINVIIGEPDDDIFNKLQKMEKVKVHVNPPCLSELMRISSFAISGAGTMAYELAVNGTPSVLVELADNQHKVAAAFKRARAGLSTGPYRNINDQQITSLIKKFDLSSDLLQEFSYNAHKLVDGLGPERLSKSLMDFYNNYNFQRAN